MFIKYSQYIDYWFFILGTFFKDCLSNIHKFVNGNFWLVFWYIMVPVFKICMVGKWNWVIGRGRKEGEKKKKPTGGGWCRSIHIMNDDDMAYWSGMKRRLGLWCDWQLKFSPSTWLALCHVTYSCLITLPCHHHPCYVIYSCIKGEARLIWWW